MKTNSRQYCLGVFDSAEDIVRNTIDGNLTDEPFYVVDIEDILVKHKNWLMKMPRVRPFYAVKCNSSPVVLELLAALGLGFDCASKVEIDTILDLGVHPSNIIYANPCKTKNFIKHAAGVNVDLMTFDNEPELYKVAQFHPSAQLVIRIKVDDSHSVCQFSSKFGTDLDNVAHLLQVAKSLNLDVVGVSFHVGSGCESAESYYGAIKDAKYVFELGKKYGYNMTLLDIGGGFPGTVNTRITFDDIAKVVNESLESFFPETDGTEPNVSIIAEPGRYYVASAFTLSTMIIAKRVIQGNDTAMMYYLNDGVYGSFNCTIFDHYVVEPIPFSDHGNGPQYLTTLWGPTCDSMDLIKKNIYLPEMNIGEWIVFKDMGAYTIAAASTFNGFQLPLVKYHIPSRTLDVLRNLTSWTRLRTVFEIEEDDDGTMATSDGFDVDMNHLAGLIPVH